MIYLIIVLAVLVLMYVYDYREVERGKLFFVILVMLYLICLAGFRYKMGTDVQNYEKSFIEAKTLFDLSSRDFSMSRYAPLYIIIQSVCRTITSDFTLMQFVIAAFVNCTIFWFVWHHTKHFFSAILFYLFFLYIMLNMEVYREALAVCVFLWSWPLFRDGRWGGYYLCAIIAFFFHVSAFVLFLLPLLLLPGIRKIFILGRLTIFIACFLLIVSFVINQWLFNFIQLIALTENMADRAATYADSNLGGNNLNIVGSSVSLIKYALYPLIALYFVKKERIVSNRYTKVFIRFEIITMLAIYVGIMNVGITILHRYHHYFYIFTIIIMADWLFTRFKVRKKWLSFNYIGWITIILPLFFLQCKTVYFTKYNLSGTIQVYDMYYPYSNVFDKEIDIQRARAIKYSKKHF
jgi:hypothetical protein